MCTQVNVLFTTFNEATYLIGSHAMFTAEELPE